MSCRVDRSRNTSRYRNVAVREDNSHVKSTSAALGHGHDQKTERRQAVTLSVVGVL